MAVHKLSLQAARRTAVRAQLLTRERPAGLLDLVRRLTLLQVDPTAAIAPNADLVAWSRLGSAYAPQDLTAALAQRRLIELMATVRPADDLALYRAEMQALRDRPPVAEWQMRHRAWLQTNDACRPWALRAPRPPKCRSSRMTWARRASPPWSRA